MGVIDLFLVSCLVLAIEGNHELDHWIRFKVEHNKEYISEFEDQYRMELFLTTKRLVDQHNLRYKLGLETSILEVNKFADYTPDEYATLNGYDPSLDDSAPVTDVSYPYPNPWEFDWRDYKAVTPVGDQKRNCASCWAFSAAGAVESHTYIKYRRLISLSEQNLVDCVGNGSSCLGGNVITAFTYIIRNKGIDMLNFYPYEGLPRPCRYKPIYKGAEIRSYVRLPKDENILASAVFFEGPISAAVDALSDEFRLYKSGIMQGHWCKTTTNHAVLIVGYGIDQQLGVPYWLVKNSYGTDWGENGYFRLLRGRGACGIDRFLSYPIVK